MTIAATRACIRGCTVKGEHFAACLYRDGRPAEGCTGCQPAEARDGSLVCRRCFGRMLGALSDAPDLVGAIRARANPLRAQVFDKVMVTGTLSDDLVPDPVRSDLIEASDALTRDLQGWARFIDPASVPARRGLRAGAEADVARDVVCDATSVIEDALSTLANDAVQIVELARYLLEDIEGQWTVHSALAKWPLVDRAWWAAQPCPYCSLRSVRVKPPRRLGQPTVYECQGCNWTRTDEDTDGPWAVSFSKRSGERLR